MGTIVLCMEAADFEMHKFQSNNSKIARSDQSHWKW